MGSDIIIEAERRTRIGKGGARQLRLEDKIPITLYGQNQTGALSLAIDKKKLRDVFRGSAGRNTIFTVRVDDSSIPVIVKDWQLHPVKGSLLHADLVVIDMSKPTRVQVPVVVEGEPVGVKIQGGVLDFATHQVEVECLPGDIPDTIRVNVSELMVGDHLSVKDLHLGEGVRSLEDPDRVIVSLFAPRVEQVAAPAEEEAPSEPELIKKGKESEAESDES